jgi:hypothetical protein
MPWGPGVLHLPAGMHAPNPTGQGTNVKGDGESRKGFESERSWSPRNDFGSGVGILPHPMGFVSGFSVSVWFFQLPSCSPSVLQQQLPLRKSVGRQRRRDEVESRGSFS